MDNIYDGMKIYFRILDVDKNDHSFEARYWTDVVTEESLAIQNKMTGYITFTEAGYPESCQSDFHYNFYDNPDPTKEDMIEIVRQSVNYPWLYLLEQLKQGNTDYSLANVRPYIGLTGEMVISNNEVQVVESF